MKLNNIKETSCKYGISEAMLKKLILNKQITRVKVGNKNYISDEVMLTYIEKNTISADTK